MRKSINVIWLSDEKFLLNNISYQISLNLSLISSPLYSTLFNFKELKEFLVFIFQHLQELTRKQHLNPKSQRYGADKNNIEWKNFSLSGFIVKSENIFLRNFTWRSKISRSWMESDWRIIKRVLWKFPCRWRQKINLGNDWQGSLIFILTALNCIQLFRLLEHLQHKNLILNSREITNVRH